MELEGNVQLAVKLEHMVVQFECREAKSIEGGGDAST